MTPALNSLVEFWQRCPLDHPPYIHPDDRPALAGLRGQHVIFDTIDFAGYLKSRHFGASSETAMHLSLLPIPYGGDLQHADIFILLLNPSISHSDFYIETHFPAFGQRLRQSIRQTLGNAEFPFIWLDPQNCWEPGFVWWERKLRSTVRVIADRKFGGDYHRALRDLSQRLAHIEISPYRSASSNSYAKLLPSAQAARSFVKTSLVPKARDGSVTIIGARGLAAWELENEDHRTDIVLYSQGQSRGVSLGPDSPGGRAILRRYGF